MDDQFLHRLRRDPPEGFATRLKWQLDRPSASRPSRPSRARVLLGFAIFGTAFALVTPPARRVLGELFEPRADNPAMHAPILGSAQPSSAAPAGVGRAADRLNTASLPPAAAPVTRPAVTPMAPAQSAAEPESAAPAAAPSADTPVRSNSVIFSGSASQTPPQRAQAAISTRQGLFRLLGVVIQPLSLMRAGRIPLDMQSARSSTHRLQVLSAMIPDVFVSDTRALDVSSRAQDLIWTQPADFESKADALTAAADVLAETLTSGDEADTRKAITQVELACDACHDVYRRN